MPLQNYTTYTETDPNSRYTVTSTKIDVAGLDRSEDAHIAYDFGAAAFSGNFEHKVTGYTNSSSQNGGRFTVWALANVINDISGLRGAAENYLEAYMSRGLSASEINIGIAEFYGSNVADLSIVLSTNTPYYPTIVRDESVGTYGTLYCYIYSDSDRTTLVDTLSITLRAAIDFRYLYGANSFNNSTTGFAFTGYVENLSIDRVLASFTVAGTSTVSMAPTVKKEAALTVAGTSTVSMAPTVKKEAALTVAGTSTVSMAPTGGIIHVQASMTVAGVSTVSMAPTGGGVAITAAMAVAGASSVTMAPTARRTASMTVTAVSTVSMAPVALLPLHPYTALGFPAGYESTVEYQVLDIAKAVVQDWTNTDVVETATGVTGYSVYDVIIRLERGFQGLILWKIPGTTYHAEEPIDLTPLAYPTLLEMKLGGIALETSVQAIPTAPLLAADYTAPDNAGISAIQTLLQGVEKWKNNKLARTGVAGTVETWVLYDNDNTTPLLTWTHDTSTKVRNKAT